MIINTIIITIILVAIIMLALGVKLLFNKDAEFTAHSCALDDNKSQDGEPACAKCQIKDIAYCSE